jgi:hypothetical protein
MGVFTDDERDCNENKDTVSDDLCGHSRVDLERVQYSFHSESYTNLQFHAYVIHDTVTQPLTNTHTHCNDHSHALYDAAHVRFD